MARTSAIQLRMRITIGISLAVAVFLALPARADRRTMIRAYEYQTQPQGNLELEVWNEIAAPHEGEFADAQITQKIELEYGLTDHWDVALYHVFKSGGPKLALGGRPGFGFDSWRLETRYRFAEKNEWPVDVMLYLEIERPADFDEGFEIEEKVILEKDLAPRFALVANLVAAQKLFHGNEGYAMEADLGARYEVSPALRLGLEFWVTRDGSAGNFKTEALLGPSLSVGAEKFWLQIGAGAHVAGDEQTRLFGRSVIGFNL